MDRLNTFSELSAKLMSRIAEEYGTPTYVYDEKLIIKKCRDVLAMPNAYGLTVRYAMKANSNKTILKIINEQGVHIDASSFNEAKRAVLAGIPYNQIMLTSQEVLTGGVKKELMEYLTRGLKYNVCSLRQLDLISDCIAENNKELSIRVHPGVGAGESSTRNTGDNYSCFGIHLSDVPKAIEIANTKGLKFTQVHTHIGSGGAPEKWRDNIDRELQFVDAYFPDAKSVSFGGGLKEARMPDEVSANIAELGEYAKLRLEEFYQQTGRKLTMEVEPGTYLIANSGYVLASIIDMKRTGETGMNFLLLDGGMDVNARPLLYGAEHPFYLVSKAGKLLYSPFFPTEGDFEAAVVGCCCESGDSLCLNQEEHSVPRKMVCPEIDDYLLVGGSGAYCSSMTPFNYNSHTQIPEVLVNTASEVKLIRRRQTLEQMLQNET